MPSTQKSREHLEEAETLFRASTAILDKLDLDNSFGPLPNEAIQQHLSDASLLHCKAIECLANYYQRLNKKGGAHV